MTGRAWRNALVAALLVWSVIVGVAVTLALEWRP